MSNATIVVIAGGHIFAGTLEGRDMEAIHLLDARQVMRIGSPDLVGGVIDKPTGNTKLGPKIARLRIPAGQERFSAQLGEGWDSVLG